MDLLIAAPVLKREWIIERWLRYAAAAAERAGLEPRFLLVGDINDPTFAVVDKYPVYDVARVYVEESRASGDRSWDRDRFSRMVELRNIMLGHVRDMAPDWFLSLDTDILAHPDQISNLIETQRERNWDAVGGYCYLTRKGTSHANYANMPASWVLRRTDIRGQAKVCDVIMAIKLMTPAAYAVDYEWNQHGEDIGWSLAAKRHRLRLGVDARVTSKHVMDPWLLDEVDARLGW